MKPLNSKSLHSNKQVIVHRSMFVSGRTFYPRGEGMLRNIVSDSLDEKCCIHTDFPFFFIDISSIYQYHTVHFFFKKLRDFTF